MASESGKKAQLGKYCFTITRTKVLLLEFKEKRLGMVVCICNLSVERQKRKTL